MVYDDGCYHGDTKISGQAQFKQYAKIKTKLNDKLHK